MVVDTSALIAILKAEPEAADFLRCLSRSELSLLSTATRLEISLVVEGQLGAAGLPELELLLSRAGIETVPFELTHWHWALQGWRRYGKGRHRAALNLGDCFSYGLARALDQPLLFKGEDFALTDLASAGL